MPRTSQKNSPASSIDSLPIAPRLSTSLSLKLVAIVVIILAIVIRIVGIHYQSADYQEFLLPWVNYLKTHGIHGFSTNFADYNFPYLYILYIVSKLPISTLLAVKAVSIIFDFALAAGIFLVTKQLTHNKLRAGVAAAVTLFLPTVIINGSVWAQCDGIYTSFIVFAFYFTLKRRWNWVWLLWGTALAFKLQAIFFLPLLGYLWWAHRDQKWWTPSLALAPLLLAVAPAVAVGRPLLSALSVYVSQSTESPALAHNAPSFLQLVYQSNDSLVLTIVFVILTVAIVLLLCAAFAVKVRASAHITSRQLLMFAVLLLFTIPFFLPHIHERYFYAAEILSVVLACTVPRMLWIVVVTQVVSFVTYAPFLFRTSGPTIPFWACAIAIGIVIVSLFKELYIKQEAIDDK